MWYSLADEDPGHGAPNLRARWSGDERIQLTRALAHRGHEIDLFYNISGELESEYRTFCRSVSRAHLAVRRPGLTGNIIRASPALLAGRRQRPQVVFVQRFDDIPFGALTGRLARAPVVCHLRGFNNYRKTPLSARQVSRFIAVSEATKRQFAAAGVDPERIDVVHNGIDPQDYPFGGIEERTRARLALGLPAEAFVVLYYGRFDVTKGIEVLLDAWRQLEPPAESARLVLIGQSATDAYTRRLQELTPDGCQRCLPTRRDVLTPLMRLTWSFCPDQRGFRPGDHEAWPRAVHCRLERRRHPRGTHRALREFPVRAR